MRLLRKQVGLLSGMLSFGLEKRQKSVQCVEMFQEVSQRSTNLVVGLDGSQLRLDTLVAFLFLQEPQTSLVFNSRKLGVFLLGLEFFL